MRVLLINRASEDGNNGHDDCILTVPTRTPPNGSHNMDPWMDEMPKWEIQVLPVIFEI